MHHDIHLVATHDQGGLLDVVTTRDDLPLPPVEVVDVGLSDHWLLRWTTSLTKPSPVYMTRTSRPWRLLDADEFHAALILTPLCHPDTWTDLDTDALLRLYDAETTAILDRLVAARTSCVADDLQTPGLTRSVDLQSTESVSWNTWLTLPTSTPPPSLSGQLSAAPIELCSVGSARRSGPARLNLSVHHRNSSGDPLTH